MSSRNQPAFDIDRFEQIADLRFKQETEQMYAEEIAKAKQFFCSTIVTFDKSGPGGEN